MSGASSDRGVPAKERTAQECPAETHPLQEYPAEMNASQEYPAEERTAQECPAETIIDPQRMEIFIEAMTPPVPQHLRRLEEEAIADKVPIIRPQTRNLIRFFIKMTKPVRILEVGTAVGFSALFMQYYAPEGCNIVTIEKDPSRAAQARKNIARYSKAAAGSDTFAARELSIEVLEGDAADILSEIREDASFDMVFMDAAKGQYIRFLPEVLRLMRAGGILITDNILQEGDVLSSRFAVTRRNRTIHSRMRRYVRALAEEPSLETLLLPTGDGAAVCVKSSI